MITCQNHVSANTLATRTLVTTRHTADLEVPHVWHHDPELNRIGRRPVIDCISNQDHPVDLIVGAVFPMVNELTYIPRT